MAELVSGKGNRLSLDEIETIRGGGFYVSLPLPAFLQSMMDRGIAEVKELFGGGRIFKATEKGTSLFRKQARAVLNYSITSPNQVATGLLDKAAALWKDMGQRL